MKYTVMSYSNDKRKLFHCGIFKKNEDGTQNRNSLLSTNYSKAQYAADENCGYNTDSLLQSGFILFLMNSELSEWIEKVESDAVSRETAISMKIHLNQEYDELGFNITKRYAAFSDAEGLNKILQGSRAFSPENTNLKKLKKWCEKAVVGLDLEKGQFNKILNSVYREISIMGLTLSRVYV